MRYILILKNLKVANNIIVTNVSLLIFDTICIKKVILNYTFYVL